MCEQKLNSVSRNEPRKGKLKLVNLIIFGEQCMMSTQELANNALQEF